MKKYFPFISCLFLGFALGFYYSHYSFYKYHTGRLLQRIAPEEFEHGKGKPPKRGRGLEYRLGRLSEKLNLSPEQEAEVKKVLVDSRLQVRKLRDKTRPEFEEIRRQTDGKIESILDEDQKQNYQELKKKHRRRTHRR
ncbi:hypothetical protein BVY02_00075 [bacterium J17]|nr:hypothetical protein BVY02_00075 [bacterium J17]